MSEARCWVCGSPDLTRRKASDVTDITSADFAISDAHYGRTAAIDACGACGFLQCSDMAAVVPYYEDLEDPAYLASRRERLLQSRRLLRAIGRLAGRELAGLRLLDVGAGSGPLVEEAGRLGMRAEGVEPSRWLCGHAREAGLAVHHGVLPHPDLVGPYDLVTLVDVIEHTTDPLQLLREAAALLAPDGRLVIVTPDVSSLAARLLGWRWWHFRLAHVGYFSTSTLERLCVRAGIAPAGRTRPDWVLPLSYLLERLERYVPVRLPRLAWLDRAAVPFNLRDSILMLARRA
ncbi:MAG: class I SAM-dependent methyltransferase [Vicinamibacterales bacterium]